MGYNYQGQKARQFRKFLSKYCDGPTIADIGERVQPADLHLEAQIDRACISLCSPKEKARKLLEKCGSYAKLDWGQIKPIEIEEVDTETYEEMLNAVEMFEEMNHSK